MGGKSSYHFRQACGWHLEVDERDVTRSEFARGLVGRPGGERERKTVSGFNDVGYAAAQ
ncbi:hypothetical protein AB0D04_34420 [Streptomyces sp. NPDC048483]|uniref:hypothetical protein n=1 Tax=Streptomyces sp. NPDC048483 TaxID=3154927 RepID=UPI0034173044